MRYRASKLDCKVKSDLIKRLAASAVVAPA
jgi:hypothetical protein